jgi:serine/threonine protein kinase
LLGVGQWGEVFQGFDRETGEPVAIKKIYYLNKRESIRAILQREIEVCFCRLTSLNISVIIVLIFLQMMKKINHPSVVRLYDTVLDNQQTYLYLIMELCTGGDLEGYLKEKAGKVPVHDIQHIMRELGTFLICFIKRRKLVF